MHENSRYIKQGTPEWFAAKSGVMSSSNVHCLDSGKTTQKYLNYINSLVGERISGTIEPVFSKSLQWGIDNEPLARARYEELTGNKVDPVGFLRETELNGHPCLHGCSTDGLVSFDKIVEFKCPYTRFIERIREDVTKNKEYYHQMQMGLMRTGRSEVHYVIFDPRMPKGKDIVIQSIYRDEKIIDKITANLIRGEMDVRDGLKEAEEKFIYTQKLIAA